MNYQYEVVHVPSAKNIADSLSRLSGKCRATSSVKNEDGQYIRAVAQHAVPAALSVQDIEDASADDEDLQVVRSCLKSGNWNDCPHDNVAVGHELTRIGKLVLRGTQLVIPAVLRADVMNGRLLAGLGSSRKAMVWRIQTRPSQWVVGVFFTDTSDTMLWYPFFRTNV